jgi:hypothetical protein
LPFSNIQCTLTDVSYALPSYHSLRAKNLVLNSKDSIMQIDSLKLIPQLSKFELGKKLGHQADYINAMVSSVEIKGLDVMQLRQKKLIASEMNISRSKAYFFRDRRLPRRMKNQPNSAEYLAQIPFDILISRFKLHDANIISEEFPKEGNESGYIKITGVNIKMQPLRSAFLCLQVMNMSKVQSMISGCRH